MKQSAGREHALQVAEFIDSLVNQYGFSLAVAVPVAGEYAMGLAMKDGEVTIREDREREPWEDGD